MFPHLLVTTTSKLHSFIQVKQQETTERRPKNFGDVLERDTTAGLTVGNSQSAVSNNNDVGLFEDMCELKSVVGQMFGQSVGWTVCKSTVLL